MDDDAGFSILFLRWVTSAELYWVNSGEQRRNHQVGQYYVTTPAAGSTNGYRITFSDAWTKHECRKCDHSTKGTAILHICAFVISLEASRYSIPQFEGALRVGSYLSKSADF